MDHAHHLYPDVIKKHALAPLYRGILTDYDLMIKKNNPLCGDSLDLYLKLSPAQTVEACGFYGFGCALFLASTSIMLAAIQSHPIALTHSLLCQKNPSIIDTDDLRQLRQVRLPPSRELCCHLPFVSLAEMVSAWEGKLKGLISPQMHSLDNAVKTRL